MRGRGTMCGVCGGLLAIAAAVHAEDWPCWRGPRGDGHVPDGVAVPAALPAAPPVVWRVPVGFGLSSPVVSGGRVFHLDNQDGKETVHALNAANGRELWRAPLDDTFTDSQSAPGPRCTPAADGDRVYAQSCRGELQCLNAADGKAVWRINYVKDLGAEFTGEQGASIGATRHGFTAAPVVDGDRLIASAGGKNGAGVVCFDKRDGRVIWKSQNDTAGYGAPILATLAGVRQVVSFTAEALIGLDAADGRLLWRVPVKTGFGRHAVTPVAAGDLVVAGSYTAGLYGVKVAREGDGVKAETAWVSKPAAPNYASPVAVGSTLFMLGPGDRLMAVDLQNGQRVWAQEEFSGAALRKGYAALTVMGSNLLILADNGTLLLVAADPVAFRQISRAPVCGPTWCSPAYAGGRLYLRDEKELLCVALTQ